jgi:hypothetical protein
MLYCNSQIISLENYTAALEFAEKLAVDSEINPVEIVTSPDTVRLQI